jgi:hypothetical protein
VSSYCLFIATKYALFSSLTFSGLKSFSIKSGFLLIRVLFDLEFIALCSGLYLKRTTYDSVYTLNPGEISVLIFPVKHQLMYLIMCKRSLIL